jgi:hypothetical protein
VVDVAGNLFEVWQVLGILAHPEIQGIVDGAFGACGEFAGCAPGDGTLEDELDAVGARKTRATVAVAVSPS